MSAYSAAILATTGLAAYWPLSESSGSVAADASGGGSAGSYVGGFTLGQGGLPSGMGGATGVLLDGTSGYVTAPVPAAVRTTHTSLSLEYWAWGGATGMSGAAELAPNATPSTTNIHNWGVRGGTSASGNNVQGLYGQLRYFGPAGVYLTANAWNHIVLVTDGSGYPTIYLNGTAVYSDTSGVMGGSDTMIAMIVGVLDGGFAKGPIAQVAVYGVALNAAQVKGHYLTAIQPTIASNVAIGANGRIDRPIRELISPGGQVAVAPRPARVLLAGSTAPGRPQVGEVWPRSTK